MEKPNQIEVIVKIPLDMAPEREARLWRHIAAEVLKERDWSQPHENKMTFRDAVSTNPNIIEIRMTLAPDMTRSDLTALVSKFTGRLKQ
ncbi:MAG: hypothetical protein FWF97_04110 [Alphaproteobacteria bacterium]|nr:hypothetical protein [Alphaproteobacteria bacterium]